MDEQKYYTPFVADFFEGYLFEVNIDGKWVEVRYSLAEGYLNKLEYRTRYLSRQQIEAEGWAFKYDSEKSVINPHCQVFDGMEDSLGQFVSLYYIAKSSRMLISVPRTLNNSGVGSGSVNLFAGQCKSVNELRKIMRWVGIKTGEKC